MKRISSILILLGIISLISCKQETDKMVSKEHATKVEKLIIPEFNADSAYTYIKQQVAFGPRIAGSEAHELCEKYFVDFFKRQHIEFMVQEFKSRSFDGKILNGKNIIASINPQDQRRIMLSAHWDSRPFADQDDNDANHYTPIDGANDGASGVGVLMEVARLLSKNNPTIGVDIVLFDLEDYGQHASGSYKANSENTWCLGSQYWSKNPHKPGYDARYGILLDMVGAQGAVFYKEYYSRIYAPGVLSKVWKAAEHIGYGNYFKDMDGGAVLDDHVFINKNAYIPTIDIIHYDQQSGSGFFPYWHTVEDKLDKIDPFSLEVVGKTLMQVIYNEK